MKKLALFVFGALMITSIDAQNIIDEAFAQYKEKDNYTKVNVTGKMFEMASEVELKDEDENLHDIKELVSDIESFKMIFGTDEVDTKAKYFDGVDIISARYEELMSVDDKEGNFSLYIDEDNGVVYEVVIIGAAEDKFMVASLVGQMDLRRLGQITKRIKKEGLALEAMMSDEKHDVKIYPNPAPQGSELSLEIPDEMLNASAQIVDMQGKVYQDLTINQRNTTIPTSDLVAGRYILKMTNGELKIRKKFIVQ